MEAARALRLGNSAVAIQLLQQLTVSAPTFDRGRAHLVSLLLVAGIVTQRTTLLEHIDRLAESPTYGEWAHCLRALAGVAFRAVPRGEVGDGLGERDAICERLGPPEQTRCP